MRLRLLAVLCLAIGVANAAGELLVLDRQVGRGEGGGAPGRQKRVAETWWSEGPSGVLDSSCDQYEDNGAARRLSARCLQVGGGPRLRRPPRCVLKSCLPASC